MARLVSEPMARAPKPTPLKLLHGDRKSRINRAEPRPRDLEPERPPWLSPYAVEEWERLGPDLVEMGVVKRVDSTLLAVYCEAVALWRILLEAVAADGLTVTDRDGGTRKNPAVAQAQAQLNAVRLLGREFGLSPSARGLLRLEGNPWAGLGVERLFTSG